MSRIHVVLHRPIYPRNIGMCARAMGNLDGGRLILVAPRCDINEEAKQGAVHAQRFLREATIYRNLDDFQAREGRGIRIALTGKDWRLKKPDELEQTILAMMQEPQHPIHDRKSAIYLVFGTEDDGLAKEEMELCHHVCRLPTFGEISSLNLSHAVLLALYIVQARLRRLSNLTAPPTTTERRSDTISAPLYYPSETIKKWLEALGFDLGAKRISIEKKLNRIFLSRCPTDEELRVIDSVLQQTVRKLNEPRR